MNRRVVIVLSLGLCLALAGVRPGVAAAAEADDRAAKVAKLESQRAKLDAERRGLEAELTQKSKEIAALKKQRASWSRDQKLDARLREAKDLAVKLDQKTAQLRAVDDQLRGERKALVKATEAELAGAPAPTPGRKAQLEKWRADASKKLGGKKLKVTDETWSPYDDPEDLDEKAATLEENEAELRAEEQRLAKRAAYYRKQAKLQRAQKRAKEGDVFDEQPRRGGSGGGGGRLSSAPEAADDGTGGAPAPPPSSPGGDFGGVGADMTDGGGEAAPGAEPELGGDPTVIYADVVDPDTLAAMEKAERSGDPEAKAAAAERALKDVKKRADRVRAKRLEMQKRAKELREKE